MDGGENLRKSKMDGKAGNINLEGQFPLIHRGGSLPEPGRHGLFLQPLNDQ